MIYLHSLFHCTTLHLSVYQITSHDCPFRCTTVTRCCFILLCIEFTLTLPHALHCCVGKCANHAQISCYLYTLQHLRICFIEHATHNAIILHKKKNKPIITTSRVKRITLICKVQTCFMC